MPATAHAEPENTAAAEPAPPAAPAGTEPGAPDAPPVPPAPPAPTERAPLPPTKVGEPVINVRVAEPPPPEPLHAHRHDGFYLRTSVGLLTAHTFVTSNSLAHPSYTVSGGGIALDAMVGGSPSVGLALGGALSLHSFGQGSGSSSAGLALLGAFVDGFPMPNQGLHLGGMLGFAGSRTSRPGGIDELSGRGLGMSAWIGDDFWVADEWSLGGLIRLSGAITRDGSEDKGPNAYRLESSSYALAFLVTVLYH